MSYDIIGDIHGHADKLRALLSRMQYTESQGVWRHSDRKAVFLGDYIDRGPKQLETVSIVRRMVEAGTAEAIMGNHEFNAIAWYLKHPKSARRHLRTHTGSEGKKNRSQHRKFLCEVKAKPGLHKELVDWFLTLPLWLDRPTFRAVHACWHPEFMGYLSDYLDSNNCLSADLMPLACREPAFEPLKDSPIPSIFKAVEALTKGIEVPLPAPAFFPDKDGHRRTRVRIAWWKEAGSTFRNGSLLSPFPDVSWGDRKIPSHAVFGYPTDKPLFFGHYWFQGGIGPLPGSENAACLDYSVAMQGKLVAYRLGEKGPLKKENFVWV
jgi:hypothetical protein